MPPPPRRQKTVTSQTIVREECCSFRETVNSKRQQTVIAHTIERVEFCREETRKNYKCQMWSLGWEIKIFPTLVIFTFQTILHRLGMVLAIFKIFTFPKKLQVSDAVLRLGKKFFSEFGYFHVSDHSASFGHGFSDF